jgi:hypothetical protein
MHRRPKVTFSKLKQHFLNRHTNYEAPIIGNVLFDGSLIRASSNYGCFMTIDETVGSKFAEIPDNLKV